MSRRIAPLLAWAGLGLLPVATTAADPLPRGAFPNRNLSFVAVPTSAAPWARDSARLVAMHARERLGLLPDKVHVLEHPPTRAAFQALFQTGKPFQNLSSDDLLMVYLVGERASRADRARGVRLADGTLPWRDLARVPAWLRQGPGPDGSEAGQFDGAVLLILDGVGALPRPSLKRCRQIAALSLDAGRLTPFELARKIDAEQHPILVAGHGVLGALSQTRQETVTLGALALTGALERLLEPTQEGTGLDALSGALIAARRGTGVRISRTGSPRYDDRHFHLFERRRRIVLYPGAGPVPSALKLLAHIKATLEAKRDATLPEHLRDTVEITQSDVEDPTADISCDGDADSSGVAEIECFSGDVTLYASGEFKVENADPRLADLAAQVLNDYPSLVARNWSGQRRDLRPLDLVVLIDRSVSMAYHDPVHDTDPALARYGPSKRELVLLRLASTVSAHAERLGQSARLTVLLFGSTVAALPLPGGHGSVTLSRRLSSEVLQAYASIFRTAAQPEPYTGIAAAMQQAVKTLSTGDPRANRHVVLLTDGRETLITDHPRQAVIAAAQAVAAQKATLHTIGLSEQEGRLAGYLARMRAGGEVLRRYVALLEMRFAPERCRSAAGWTPDQARRCGEFYADLIDRSGAYDPALLESLRRSQRSGVPIGLFLNADSSASFQRKLSELVARLTGRGIYAIRGGSRRHDPNDENLVIDAWRFDLDLPDEALLVIYGRDALRAAEWTVTRNRQVVDETTGVLVVGETSAITRIHLPKPARGVWEVERRGRLQ